MGIFGRKEPRALPQDANHVYQVHDKVEESFVNCKCAHCSTTQRFQVITNHTQRSSTMTCPHCHITDDWGYHRFA